ncbi:C4-dicarboxylate transport protein [Caballeronia glathei]|nr:C4-dicarboxylate transport protein [Caballeronia glathei]
MEGSVLLLGVDRFLNEARAVTNLIGNGVATVVVARWKGALEKNTARAMLDGHGDTGIEAFEPAVQGTTEPFDRPSMIRSR